MRGYGPLRFPGAKANLAPFVAEFIERHRLVGLNFVEPFAGSAAATRYLIKKDLIASATLWEIDPGAFAFWKSALLRTEELQERISTARVTLVEFDRCREFLFRISGEPDDEVEAGFAFLFLNRTSYSGIVGAGPIGGRNQSSAYSIDCRFNKELLRKQIGEIGQLREKIGIYFGDGIAAIQKAGTENFLYVDPPYFSNGKKFYRMYFKAFEHYRLRKALESATSYWLLSYDYDKKVEYLYRKLPSSRVELYHSARCSGAKQEILVSPLGFNGISVSAPMGETA